MSLHVNQVSESGWFEIMFVVDDFQYKGDTHMAALQWPSHTEFLVVRVSNSSSHVWFYPLFMHLLKIH